MMKSKKNFEIIFCCGFLICSHAISLAQIDTVKSVYSSLDTLKNYDSNLFVGFDTDENNQVLHYFVGDKIVSKEVYDKYDSIQKNIKKCQPCYLETYDK